MSAEDPKRIVISNCGRRAQIHAAARVADPSPDLALLDRRDDGRSSRTRIARAAPALWYLAGVSPVSEPAFPRDADDGVDITLIRWMLSLSPEERLAVLQGFVDSAAELTHDSPATEVQRRA
jgi:hypothetical protein